MRRALILLAFAACERRPPEDATGERSIEPLVIGRSPDRTAVGEPTDAGAVIDTSLRNTRDAAVVWTGCHLDAKGRSGAIAADLACVVEQEDARYSFDAGAFPFLGIWDSLPRVPGDPEVHIVLRRVAMPVAGVQPTNSFYGMARISLGTQTWSATTSPFGGATMGTFTLTLTSMRAVRDSGLGAYELHGKVDAQLLPDWQGSGVGYIDLHADF